MGLPSSLAQLHGVTGEKTTHLLTLVAYYAVGISDFEVLRFPVIDNVLQYEILRALGRFRFMADIC
jgi:hypothetical protein